nr:hypothetical protein [Tanacetum cinerariifolium]
MENPNITMEEYVRLEEEKAQKRGKVFNWETAKYGKIWYDEDVHDLRFVEIEFPAIFFNDNLTSNETLFCEPMRYPFLKYQGLEYYNRDISDFKERMLMEHRDDDEVVVFTSQAWVRVFETRRPLVRELILELLSTFRFGEVLLALGLHTWEEMESPDFARDPLLRLFHRMMAHSIAGRNYAHEKEALVALGVGDDDEEIPQAVPPPPRTLVMSSDSHVTITYTSMSSYEVIVNGYYGMPVDPLDPYVQLFMEAPPSPDNIPGLEAPPSPDYIPGPEAPPSPDYIPGPEYPEYLPPVDDVLPAKEQPLPAAVSPTAESPGYIMESEPKMEPEEDGDDEKSEEDSIDYPTSGGDNDTDDDGDDLSKDDADDEEEEESSDSEEEEEEHLALTIPAPALYSFVSASEETEPFEEGETAATPPPFGYRVAARIYVQPYILMPFHSESEVERLLAIPTPPLSLVSPTSYPLPPLLMPLPIFTPLPTSSFPLPSYEVGESSVAAARQIRPALTIANRCRAIDRLIGRLRRERRYFHTLSTTYAHEVAHSRDYCTHIMDYCQSREVYTSTLVTQMETLQRDVSTLQRQHIEHAQRDVALEDGDSFTPAPIATTTTVTEAQLQALIDQGVAASMADAEASRVRNGYDSNGLGPRLSQAVRQCTYPDFLKCQPLNFKGTEGVIGLTQWFEKMKSVFNISKCTAACQVKYAACTLQGVALTWWNSHVKFVTLEVAQASPWKTLKKMMTDKYCPRGEIKKLETELWELKTKGTDVIDKRIRDAVENKQKFERTSGNNQYQPQQNKRQNTGRAYAAGNSDRNMYTGPKPLCSKCDYHHEGPCPPRCNNCKRIGHLARDCRSRPANANNNNNPNNNNNNNNRNNNNNNQKGNGCYECGAQGHFKRNCPKLKNNNHGNQGGNNNAQARVYVVGNAGVNPDNVVA